MIEKLIAVFHKLGFGPMPEKVAIEKLIAFLHKLGLEPTPEEVADILWYAAQKLPIASVNDLSQKRALSAPTSELSTASSAESTQAVRPSGKKRRHKENLKLYPTDKDNQWDGIPFRSPGASALPGALKLVRALRPLRHRVPSFHQVMLDEEATAHQIAQTDIWIPVQQPVSILWLEVAVVVEYSPSMYLWQQTVQELCLLLERQGAFRDVRLWHLDTSHQDEMVLTTGTSSVKRSYRELINQAATRMILVVTDCISSVWHNGKINHWLTAWGHEHPVALIQMLPQQLWSQTQVRTAQLLHVTAPYQGAPNKRLKREARSPWLKSKMPSGVPTPILTLEPDFMAAWVQFIASPTDSKKMPALIFKEPIKKSAKKTGASSTVQKPKPTAEQRFIAFKANASPTAFQLACLLAATPLTLPIMRLVQKTMLPESQQVHLAEFFLSGLLRRIVMDKAISAPDEMAYDFLEADKGFDIRGKLLDIGLVPDAIQVQRLVSSYIAEHYGQPNDFQAKLENPDLLTDTTIDSQNQFFASVSIEVLRRLGGRYAKAASLLSSADINDSIGPIDEQSRIEPEKEVKQVAQKQQKSYSGYKYYSKQVAQKQQKSYSGYKYDIFVSYAHVDDIVLEGAKKGWVTTLIKSLNILLAHKLGHANTFSLWMDYEDRGNSAATTEILEHLKNSATLVLILSPGYLASPWCHLELNTFLGLVDTSGCVFVVERDEVEERPHQLSDLRGYRFWRRDDTGQIRTLATPQPNPNEREYYNLIEDLGRELVDQLKQLKKSAKIPRTLSQHHTPTTPRFRATIFLAEVTDDLQEQRNQIKRYLEQYDIQIVPDTLYFFSGDNANERLRQAIEADLKKSTLFVQLLSHSKPFRPPGMSTPPLQYEYAQAVKDLPILQWRDPQLDLTNVTDSAQKDLLNSTQVMATSLEEFRKYIIQRLRFFIFISCVPKDKALAEEIGDILLENGLFSVLPRLEEVTPAEKRKDIENNFLQDCDVVIILCDNTLEEWTREQLRLCLRLQSRRKRSLKIIAVFYTSPTEELLLGVKLPNLRVFDCATLKDSSCLPSFIQTLTSQQA